MDSAAQHRTVDLAEGFASFARLFPDYDLSDPDDVSSVRDVLIRLAFQAGALLVAIEGAVVSARTPDAARISELEAMLAASEEHTQHWEAEAIRLRRLLSPFAKSEVCRGFGGDLIQIYVVRDDVRAACKEFA